MARIEVSVDIAASPETVWSDVSVLESHVEWMADAESIEFDSDSRAGVGTVMRVLTKVGPLHTTDIIRVLEWDPPHRIGVRHEGLVTGTGEFNLVPTPDGTRFVWAEDLEMPLYFGGRLGAAVAKPILELIWRKNLQRLAARFR